MKSATQMKLVDGTTAVVHSDIMRKLMLTVERVARNDAAVLIFGETGSGKELVAQAIHQHSLRCGKPFIDVNCAALPEHLVESELFGYEKGAFSGAENTKPGLFELADHGTLFLDEIGELDAKIQAKLLRVLDGVPYYRLGGHKKVAIQVRVIAATNRNLEDEVMAGKFRRDLYHRLSQFQLRVPPLRERPDDVVAIAEYFLDRNLPAVRFTTEAKEMLQRYTWPGNVRELKNVVLRVATSVKPDTKEIRASDLPAVICGIPEPSAAVATFSGNLEEMERKMIFQALAASNGNQVKAAQQLGISGRTLRRKLEKYKKEEAYAGPDAPGSLSEAGKRYFRVTIELPVDLTLEGRQIEAASVNISSGGMAVQCSETLSHGAALELAFKLPESDSYFEAQAKVVWTSPGGLIGLSFVEVHPAIQRELQQWLLAKAKEEGWTEGEKGA